MKHSCSCISGLFLILVLQLILTIVRIVFDILGLQYVSICADICQVLGLIIGSFGSWRFKRPLLTVYCIWTLLWITWSSYLVCFYLEVGVLSLEEHSWTVNLFESTDSWFKTHPFGCATNINSDDVFCWSYFQHLEACLAAVNLILAIFGLVFSIGTIKEITNSKDNSSVMSMQYVNSLERDGKHMYQHDHLLINGVGSASHVWWKTKRQEIF